MYLKSCIFVLLLVQLTTTSPLMRNHHVSQKDTEVPTPETQLTAEEIDKKIEELRHEKLELLKYKIFLEELSEIMTDFDADEYIDPTENANEEDLLHLLKQVEEEARRSQDRHKKKHHHKIHTKHSKYVDYDPEEMQGDMPAMQNSLESEENEARPSNADHLSTNVLEKFNLTREDLLALSTRMQGAMGRQKRPEGSAGNSLSSFVNSGAGDDDETPQQDAMMTMSPQELRDNFNLTVEADGRVRYDRQVAKLMALQQIKKNMMNYFQPRGRTIVGSNDEALAAAIPASLSRKPLTPRHAQSNPAMDEAHKAFLMHAQQYQQQQQMLQQQDQAARDPNAEMADDGFSSRFTVKNVAYHPRCELPKNTDADSWNDGSTLNLIFNVSSSIKTERPNFTVDSAILRVFKVAQNSTTPNRNSDEEDQVRISVAWYTRSLKKHRVKRKISDSKMVPVSFSGWIELNLKGGVTFWKNGRNHGIAIIVEDQEGMPLKADNFIQKHDCLNTYPRPIPWIVHNKYTIPMDDQNVHYRFPRLDVLTRELASYDYQVLPSLVNTFHAGFSNQELQDGPGHQRTNRQTQSAEESSEEETSSDTRTEFKETP